MNDQTIIFFCIFSKNSHSLCQVTLFNAGVVSINIPHNMPASDSVSDLRLTLDQWHTHGVTMLSFHYFEHPLANKYLPFFNHFGWPARLAQHILGDQHIFCDNDMTYPWPTLSLPDPGPDLSERLKHRLPSIWLPEAVTQIEASPYTWILTNSPDLRFRNNVWWHRSSAKAVGSWLRLHLQHIPTPQHVNKLPWLH